MGGNDSGNEAGTAESADSGQLESPLELTRVADIESVGNEGRWLIDQLWSAGGVGIIGGTPKTGKTWFGLELAVSVASGAAALGRFEVPVCGPVIVFPAEDNPQAIRDRVAGIAEHKGVELAKLPLFVITSQVLRLDEPGDRAGLRAMLARVRPKLLVLDPLVRLHGGDENHLGHIAELLGFLRTLQREFDCAIVLTHHVAKKRRGKSVGGSDLRGSGELHAWGDSNIYLDRTDEGLVRVQIEHRAALAPDALFVELRASGDTAFLEAVDGVPEPEETGTSNPAASTRSRRLPVAPKMSVRERILAVLSAVAEPVSQSDIREVVRVRNQVLSDELRKLAAEGAIERPGGKRRWALTGQ